ncbi:DUF2953 domain-containing protein [Faecalimonas umbilicata]|uniref:DUF2953 domain-containing protein n=1 Tax=Faecalimonas umbilicata TaxID=1912855 RepID=UPI002A83522B|nr:DUF2953 domain-containing protein [Faecalimonas umbilicata]MDY4596565.1 DUF2953 domain-containing protein [Faecalimonas umbilicata]
MLHILLLILKWIGIVLAVFLLLVLLLINLGLFVPVRYRADASCQNDIETLEAEFELSWMWKLFFLTACWKKGKADMKIRIGWKYLFSEEKEGKSEEKIEVPEEKEENDLQKEKEEQKFLKEQKESLPPEKTNRSLPENNVQEQAEKRECHQEKTESGIDKEEEEKESFTADRRKAGGRKKKPLWDRMKEKISEWIERCKSFWRKILAMGRNFRGKKEQIESFLTDASHRRAFCSLKREVRRFLGHVSPKDVKIVGKIGLEDPYMTGQALAVLGMLFPFLGENTVIVPDFENKVLEGSVHIEGKIHNFRMLAILWRLIKDRDVRKIIIDIKKLKW